MDQCSKAQSKSSTKDSLCKSETDFELTRSSKRILAKKNKQFQLPSKEKILSSISDIKSPRNISQLKPRKLINNYIKVTSRYNYDRCSDNTDDSLDGFIDDDIDDSSQDSFKNKSLSDSDSSSSSSAAIISLKSKRRLTTGLESDDDSTESTNSSSSFCPKKQIDCVPLISSQETNSLKEVDTNFKASMKRSPEDAVLSSHDLSDEEIGVNCKSTKKKRFVIQSSEESSDEGL